MKMKRKIESILFTHIKPEIWHYKISKALKKKGIKTSAFYLKKCDREFYGQAFDEIICLELPNMKAKTVFIEFFKSPGRFAKFFYKLFTAKSDISITEAPPNYLAAFFLWVLKGKTKRVLFPYDIFSARVKDTTLLTGKQTLGEKYSFKNADAIMYKEGPGVLGLLPNDYEADKKPNFFMPMYSIKEWFAKPKKKEKLSKADGEIHIVNPSAFFGGESVIYNSMIPYITEIIKQKIHLHFYVSGDLKAVEEKGQKEVALNNPELIKYFHIHKFVAPEKLAEEISKYDLGLYLTHYTDLANPNFPQYTSGNKISSYMEAGIPFVVKEENKLNSDMAKKHGIGVVVEDTKNMKDALDRFDLKKAEKKVLEFREKYTFDEHADEIIDFFSSLKEKYSERHK